VLRDPWGQPYIITLDLNFDNKCRDAFYKQASVSLDTGEQGFNGLRRAVPSVPTVTSVRPRSWSGRSVRTARSMERQRPTKDLTGTTC